VVQEEQAAETLAAVVGRAPGSPWVEAARHERVVDRAELAAVLAAWRGQGVAGRRLGLAAADPVAFAVLFVALVAAGATVVPLDADAPADATRALLDAAGTTAVVAPAGQDVPVGADDVVRADPATFRPAAPAPDGTTTGPTAPGGCLLFSSGSTGPRKAIRLPEPQLLHVARAVARGHRLTAADRGYNPLPLFHVNAEVIGLLAPLVSGGTVVLDRRFHRTGFWPLVRERRITWINAVPAVITILSQEPPGEQPPTGLRFVRSASAPLPAAVLERFEQRYGVPVIESYGMTEAASQITANPLDDRRPGTVGVPVDVELRVVGDDGAAAAPGEVGRVLLRGPGVITGYEGDAGADRFDAEGWLDTGDLGSLDADGYLTLAGRGGDVINRSGEKIFPREVEDVLRAHPAVREAVVVGRADPVLGQVPVAWVVPAEGAPPDLAEQLAGRCADALPRAHRPAEVLLAEDLPHGPTGKTVRRLVAEHDAELLTAGRGGSRS
jgi:acyl-CoA synthetase (AMP-forming)/AMP-acid ligase II